MGRLPPGQVARKDFPRFGLNPFAERFPREPDREALMLGGDLCEACTLEHPFDGLERVQQQSDFHCVTTWSVENLRWSGVRFSEFYQAHVVPRLVGSPHKVFVITRCQDGFRSCLPIEDLLNVDVLIADRLNDAPLCVTHGAPYRLVAPAHYGYKNPKHVKAFEFWSTESAFKPISLKFMVHPRGRVAEEERGLWFPQRFLRWLYRPLVGTTVRRFERAMAKQKEPKQGP